MSSSTERPLTQFSIRYQVSIAASPDRVFEALTRDIAKWWSHVTYDPSGRPDVRVEPYVGGRFYEMQAGKERLYGIITRYEPASKLWLQGPMGIHGCVFGTIAYELEPTDDHTTVVNLSHNAIGQIDDEVAAGYRDGWRHLLDHDLREFVEAGSEAWSMR
jgi:uncharacterized protein YndB with AHSA1/START domain